jgi:hypothetical protein
MWPVTSSWVAAIGYDVDARDVHVALIGGGAYAYESVPPDVWRLFVDAESKGSFVNEVLKPGYRCRKA